MRLEGDDEEHDKRGRQADFGPAEPLEVQSGLLSAQSGGGPPEGGSEG